MPTDALRELLAWVAAAAGEPVYVAAKEMARWPAAAIAAMKVQRLLVKTSPATSAVCPGCERQCVMRVHVLSAPTESRAFIVCDKRDDINRVPVAVECLEQWKASGNSVAHLVTALLDLRAAPGAATGSAQWELGRFKGNKHAAHLSLLADGAELRLSLAGHSIALTDVLEFDAGRIVVDQKLLWRRVDQPVASGGSIESASQRREYLKKRVADERAKGTKPFLRIVAEEEGITVPRLKQIIYKK